MIPYSKIEIHTALDAAVHGKPVHQAVLEAIRALKIAARCTVTQGQAGCYETGDIATTRIEVLSVHLPVKIEIVAPKAETERVLRQLRDLVTDGIVLVSEADMVLHKTRKRLLPRQLRVRDIMTASPRCLTADASVSDAIRLMLEADLACLPVVDAEGKLAGIVTQRDLIERAQMPVRLGLLAAFDGEAVDAYIASREGAKVADVMTNPVHTIADSGRVSKAVETMMDRGVKRLPVVDDAGKLCGIITRLDVFRAIMTETPDWQSFEKHHIVVDGKCCVREILRRDVPVARPADSIEDLLSIID
jgi:CBS domain-containing protein